MDTSSESDTLAGFCTAEVAADLPPRAVVVAPALRRALQVVVGVVADADVVPGSGKALSRCARVGFDADVADVGE